MKVFSMDTSPRRTPLSARVVTHTFHLADIRCFLNVDMCSLVSLMAMAERLPSHFIRRPVRRLAADAATPADAEDEAMARQGQLGRLAGASTG